MKALITYYSGSGQTAHVAELIGEELHNCGWQADLYRVHRKQELGMIGSVRETKSGASPALAEPPVDATPYDIVFVGFPIWAGQPSSPARSLVANVTNAVGKKTAVFAMSGFPRGFEAGLPQMCAAAEAAGAQVVARCGFSRGGRSAWHTKVRDFVKDAVAAT